MESIRGLPHRPARKHSPASAVADIRKLILGQRTFHIDFTVLFLIAFDPARMQLDPTLAAVGMPGSNTIPAGCAVRSLLALKPPCIGQLFLIMAETLDGDPTLFLPD